MTHASARRELLPGTIAMAAALVVAWIAYRPGLAGGFLFDDFANLPALGAYGRVDDWTTFWRYITSGGADPTGRPLSLLTFLVDARDWPADPAPFKRTGVLLHMGNATLLFALLLAWGRIFGADARRAALAAAFAAAMWLLHPLLVSTTLYIVQREAMLPATFMLLGLGAWTAGRLAGHRGRAAGPWLGGAALLACTVLATLAKANGVLLPLLAWLVDALLLRPRLPVPASLARQERALRLLVLWLPSAVVLAYFAQIVGKGFVHGTAAHRPWTMGERMMTEARVLLDYVRLLWLPRPYTTGLFNDAFPLSRGLLSPWTTLAAIAAIVAATAACVAWRRRLGLWPLAVLFFLLGHLMETWVVALELYYEHRNYIPAMLLFWPLGMWLAGVPQRRLAAGDDAMHDLPGLRTPLRLALALLLPLMLAGMTHARATLWGDLHGQALLWAELNPDSPRAQAYAAQLELSRGETGAAIARLERLLAKRPDEIQLALNLVGAKCRAGTLVPADIAAAEQALRTTMVLQRMGYEWFMRSLRQEDGACPLLDLQALERLLAAARENPQAAGIPGRQQDFDSIEGMLALKRDDADRALALFDRAYVAAPRPAVALRHAAVLGSNGFPEQGLIHLRAARSARRAPARLMRSMDQVHQRLLEREGYWAREEALLECQLLKDSGKPCRARR